ncbi:MAG: restriction endonuclease [Chloroflexi bacterium]|nr:restriction endonuclease [Chloroflexota bacterium]
MKTNVLYYGDNLDILRRFIPDESVDLIYLDPPFNSNASYSVIFKDESGRGSDAQMTAFDDTWHWGPDPERQYLYLTNSSYHQGSVAPSVSALIGAFHQGIRPSPMLAYLVEMAVRLVELHRVLKPTGSLYLHCDPTASHHLKLVLDAIFGPEHYINEIVWKRQTSHNDAAQGAKHFGRLQDVLLFYAKSSSYYWTQPYRAYDPEYVEDFYRSVEPGTGRRFTLSDITAPGGASPEKRNPHYEFLGVTRYWRFSEERMRELFAEGRIVQSKPGTVPRQKRYLDEMPGMPLGTWWDDIRPVQAQGAERLPYPTQKPLALLERIISASSKPGDIVLDPFCGCGTATVAAQKLGRQWIGIDITYLAIAVMRQRLRDSFPELGEVEVVNRPTEVAGARAMLADGSLEHRYQFQWWALDLVGATPRGSVEKKGADKGVDGVITFTGAGNKPETCIVSVKSGTVNRAMVAQLKGDMQAHGAAMGLFVTLEEPTAPMRLEAAEAGYYHSDVSGKDYPGVQIITIRELLDEGRKPSLPLLVLPAFQQARPVRKAAEQAELFG